MIELDSQYKNVLLDILSKKYFARDAGILTVILSRSLIPMEQIYNLKLSGNPQVVILGIIEFLEQYGQDEFGSEALGRFLNTLIIGNYITDVNDKLKINDIINECKLLPQTSMSLPTPEPKKSTSEETTFLNESLIGENTLRPIAFLLRAIEVAKSVCMIAVPGDSGTGFLISPDLILTGNHVIPDIQELDKCTFRFNYQLGLNGLPTQHEDYKALSNGIFHTNKRLDYSIVEIANTPGRKWGQAIIENETPKTQDRVNIIQHAGGQPKSISIQNNFVQYVDDILIHYLNSTLPGSSGSPVFNDSWRVVGLHHAGGFVVEHSTKRKYFRNEGMRLSAILNDLPSEIRKKLDHG